MIVLLFIATVLAAELYRYIERLGN